MKRWINADTQLLRSHRYWIEDIECKLVGREEVSGFRYRYRFQPIEGRRKAIITLTENKLFKNHHVQFLDPNEEEEMASSYKLSVICRQRSDGITVYTAAIEWQFVSQFFAFEDSTLPPEERAQRALNPSHAKKIKQYLLDTPTYYLPPMIASVELDGELSFTPFETDFANGILELPMTTIFMVIDGQHRTYAIGEIMRSKDAARFKSELISVDLITNASLQLRQKIFREVNTLSKSVSRNLTTAYNDDPIAIFTNAVLATIPLFGHQFTEKEKTTLPPKSDKLFVNKHLYDATIKIKPGLGDEADFKFCQTFWETLVLAIAPWREALNGDAYGGKLRTPNSVRKDTIASHGVTIRAMSELGKYLGEAVKLSGKHESHVPLLKKLSAIDWDKTNPDWLHRAVDANGTMLTKQHNIKLILNYLKVKIGVPEKSFSKADKDLEITHIGNLGIFNNV